MYRLHILKFNSQIIGGDYVTRELAQSIAAILVARYKHTRYCIEYIDRGITL